MTDDLHDIMSVRVRLLLFSHRLNPSLLHIFE